jgi:hypothetical protein
MTLAFCVSHMQYAQKAHWPFLANLNLSLHELLTNSFVCRGRSSFRRLRGLLLSELLSFHKLKKVARHCSSFYRMLALRQRRCMPSHPSSARGSSAVACAMLCWHASLLPILTDLMTLVSRRRGRGRGMLSECRWGEKKRCLSSGRSCRLSRRSRARASRFPYPITPFPAPRAPRKAPRVPRALYTARMLKSECVLDCVLPQELDGL